MQSRPAAPSAYAPLIDLADLPDDRAELIAQIRLQAAELTRLRHDLRELETRRHTDSLIAQLATDLRPTPHESIAAFGRRCLIWLMEHFDCLHATLYLRREDPETLHLTAKLGVTALLPERIRTGETLVGQALKSRRSFLVDRAALITPAGAGLVELQPSVVLIQPLFDRSGVEGVIELSFMRKIDPDRLSSIASIAERLGSILNDQRIRIQVQALLEQTGADAHRLVQQEEELRQYVAMLEATQEESTRVQTALKQAVERNRQLFRNIPCVVFQYMINPSQRLWQFVYASPQTQALLGFEPETWCDEMNRNYRRLVHPEDRRRFIEQVRNAVRDRTRGRTEVRLRTRDGQWRWVRVEANTHQSDEQVLLAYGVIFDISHEHDERDKLLTELERLRSSEAQLLDKLRGQRGLPSRRLI